MAELALGMVGLGAVFDIGEGHVVGTSFFNPAFTRSGVTSPCHLLMATVATWAGLKIKPNDGAQFEAAIPMLRRAA
jgi:hypothetical protein